MSNHNSVRAGQPSAEQSHIRNPQFILKLLERICREFGYECDSTLLAPWLVGVRLQAHERTANESLNESRLSMVLSFTRDSVEVLARESSDADEQRLIAVFRQTLAHSALPDKTSIIDASFQECPDSQTQVLPDAAIVRQYFKDYSPRTAKEILDRLADAYTACQQEQARWSPAFIARHLHYARETISRYLNALRKAGVSEWNGIPLPAYGHQTPVMQLTQRPSAARISMSAMSHSLRVWSLSAILVLGPPEPALAAESTVSLIRHPLMPTRYARRGPSVLIYIRLIDWRATALIGAPELSSYMPSHFPSHLAIDRLVLVVIG